MHTRWIVSGVAFVAVSALSLRVWADCGQCPAGQGSAKAEGGCCALAQQAAAGCPAVAGGCQEAAGQPACGGCRGVGALAALAQEAGGAVEWVKLTRGIGIVATVGNGCPKATETLQRAAAQFPPATIEGSLCGKCDQGASLLKGGAAVIDHVNFRSGAMVLITGTEPGAVAQLHGMLGAPVETAMLQ